MDPHIRLGVVMIRHPPTVVMITKLMKLVWLLVHQTVSTMMNILVGYNTSLTMSRFQALTSGVSTLNLITMMVTMTMKATTNMMLELTPKKSTSM
jgi:hypothetical protein